MLQAELAELEEKVQRLIAAYLQMRLECKRAQQDRDELRVANAELKRRIEHVVLRIRQIEDDTIGDVQDPL